MICLSPEPLFVDQEPLFVDQEKLFVDQQEFLQWCLDSKTMLEVVRLTFLDSVQNAKLNRKHSSRKEYRKQEIQLA